MKRTIITQLVIILALVAFNGNVFGQKGNKAATKNVKIITDKDFNKTIKKGITLVDFWAVWCRPCRTQAPIIEELATEVGKNFKIGKLDIDRNKITSNKLSVRRIPTLIIFKDGKEIKRLVGLQGKQAILNELNALK